MTATGIHMGTAMAVIRIGTTDGIDQLSGPNRKNPDHRQAWVVPPERREAVLARFGLDIDLFSTWYLITRFSVTENKKIVIVSVMSCQLSVVSYQ